MQWYGRASARRRRRWACSRLPTRNAASPMTRIFSARVCRDWGFCMRRLLSAPQPSPGNARRISICCRSCSSTYRRRARRIFSAGWCCHISSSKGRKPKPGFDSDWAILLTAGHGGIGHLDVFESDAKAQAWYADKTPPPLIPISERLRFLAEGISDLDGSGCRGAAGGARTDAECRRRDSEATAVDAGVGLGRSYRSAQPGMNEGRCDVVLKFEKEQYRGIVELEALTLDVHAQAGFHRAAPLGD